ncbi:MAG: prephenate dehydratase [Bacillota bacterium]|nr:prephenate dehydratase [Bacillota bacterium]
MAVPGRSLWDVVEAVAEGRADLAVAPLENSIEGSVPLTLDLLLRHPGIRVVGEVILPVAHHLAAGPGVTLAEVREVISHPHALAQCREYLRRRLPEAVQVPAASTAEAAAEVARRPAGRAAITTRAAVERYGLTLLEEEIQDLRDNVTRFIVLGRGEVPRRTGRDKTSLVLSTLSDRPGALYRILREFAVREINLTRIESRPAKTMLGEYLFFIDFEGHQEEEPVRAALEAVRPLTSFFRILGSFPRGGEAACQEKEDGEKTGGAELGKRSG